MKAQESTPQVLFIEIDAEQDGQRIDNFLKTQLKGVPKSLIYRVLRKGEVRVNKKRVKPEYKLQSGDLVRVPPLRVAEEKPLPSVRLDSVKNIEQQIIYEDKALMVVNKPSGMAVHGGSGISFGLIESLRALRPDAKFLELVHRLDRDTSGVILVAKKRSALTHLHEQLRSKTADKHYLALVKGQWPRNRHKVKAPLQKNILQSGERMVFVNDAGKPSETHFEVMDTFANATLVKASPITGRTHQIRVHCQHAGHPIACDDKYGDGEFDRLMQSSGLNRLFLHAWQIRFIHPQSETTVSFEAPLDDYLQGVLKRLDKA
ncbi:23S rRNA pseudouridine(955/2504/2580) synthase RluC [Bowmanella sp. JS7-9]|uniref:Pseudouridine synthase n=1 Tax=Pseudobowmanella zhangzhouensis TaxID=1537679 RepID=A0ABW1XJB4_9ALTE|nr:23S rRNA pseudouridine(955/2504/2580) synthase RluC [Bowmanella sp. JS7-9]TBX27503.1 23S rRNA pseudouridylate synthase [Bowmanella sp. JS7-9]